MAYIKFDFILCLYTYPLAQFVLSNIIYAAYYINLSYNQPLNRFVIAKNFYSQTIKILCTCVFSRVLRYSNPNNRSFNSLPFLGTLQTKILLSSRRDCFVQINYITLALTTLTKISLKHKFISLANIKSYTLYKRLHKNRQIFYIQLLH